MAVLPVGIGSAEAGGYQIERSLRFNDDDSTSLTRTPSGAGTSIRIFTMAFWYKRGNILASNSQVITVGPFSSGNKIGQIGINGDGQVYTSGGVYGISTDYNSHTLARLRDPSAWYHIVVAIDTTQATEANRLKIYINGVDQDLEGLSGNPAYEYPSLNFDTAFNAAVIQRIGLANTFLNEGLDGLLAEVHMVDGQQLTPTSFGEFNSTTGVWQPKAYTGSYGTNGFYLNFSDNSGVTSTTLGADSSGNGNNWTPNNFSVTAGAGNDSLVDTPTPYGTDTGVGGEVRGNYATLNPLDSATSASNPTNGNLDWSSAAANASYYPSRGTLGVSSGKWYWEVTCTNSGGGFQIGIAGQAVNFVNNPNQQLYNCVDGYAYLEGGFKGNNGSVSSYGASYTANDVIGVALNMDAGTLVFYKNGISQGTAYSSLSGTFFAAISDNSGSNNSAATFNFGQRPFAYTAPSGFKALCTQNLPEPTIVDGGQYFNTVLYTGDGTSSRSITGVGFQPDMVWTKRRSGADNHHLFDAVRVVSGVPQRLFPNLTNAEDGNFGSLDSFNADGFTIGSNVATNASGETFAAWNWKANGAGVSNTDGTITSTVSANTDSGFSIVTYTGNGTSGATIGHGLGVAPNMIIIKRRDGAEAWPVWHSSLAGNTSYLRLNSTNSVDTATSLFNSTTPGSSVVTLGNGGFSNTNTWTYVMYAFAAIPGYSAFGSYTGNGSADGPFVFTGFKPAFLIIKKTTVDSWLLRDSVRNPYNVTNLMIVPNDSAAEYVDTTLIDFVSNGFKLRHQNSLMNANGTSHIYMAFAENPFKYSLAR